MCKHLVVLHFCSAISFLSLESSLFLLCLYSELHLSTRMFIWQLVNRQTFYSPGSAREWVVHLTRSAWTAQHWAEHSILFVFSLVNNLVAICNFKRCRVRRPVPIGQPLAASAIVKRTQRCSLTLLHGQRFQSTISNALVACSASLCKTSPGSPRRVASTQVTLESILSRCSQLVMAAASTRLRPRRAQGL